MAEIKQIFEKEKYMDLICDKPPQIIADEILRPSAVTAKMSILFSDVPAYRVPFSSKRQQV